MLLHVFGGRVIAVVVLHVYNAGLNRQQHDLRADSRIPAHLGEGLTKGVNRSLSAGKIPELGQRTIRFT